MDRMKDRISSDLKLAMKARDRDRVSTLRMVLAELQGREKDTGIVLDAKGAVPVLQSMVRTRRDAAAQFRSGGRDDLADKEEQEIEIIAAYLPAALSADELRNLVDAVISEVGATGPRDMGKVMGQVVPRVAGRAEGGVVSSMVKQVLGVMQQ